MTQLALRRLTACYGSHAIFSSMILYLLLLP